ncbi:MAG TPA: DUF2726 domain-containing protein [Opitutaceae bacterium]|nr:DUF2726 domain-containing protein [Opitutaceae bacterium]
MTITPFVEALAAFSRGGLFPVFAVVAALVILVVIGKRVFQARAETPVTDKPAFLARKTILSPAERSFLGALEAAVPEHVRVFPKVRLGDVFVTRPGLSRPERASAWNRINQKHVDFLLVRRNDLAPIAGVELDDRSHEAEDRIERDAFVNDVFRAGGVPVLHIQAQAAYSVDALRDELVAVLPVGTPK